MSSSFSSWQSAVLQDEGDLTTFQKFVYALRAPESKRQYPRRLQVFLDFVNVPGLTVEEKVGLFYDIIDHKGKNWLEGELIKFFAFQNQRAENKEISTETTKKIISNR